MHVPERFGQFSWYRGDRTDGGWYPTVAPATLRGRGILPERFRVPTRRCGSTPPPTTG